MGLCGGVVGILSNLVDPRAELERFTLRDSEMCFSCFFPIQMKKWKGTSCMVITALKRCKNTFWCLYCMHFRLVRF